MSEHSDTGRRLLGHLLAAQESGQAVALATVVRARGSVPRHAGAKMLVYDDGRLEGTVGGGEMEARVIAAAREALADGRPQLLPYSLVDPQRGDPGVCGGEVEIYVEPYLPPATVFVIGCGHVGQAVAHLASWLDYQVVVYLESKGKKPDLRSCCTCPVGISCKHAVATVAEYLEAIAEGLPVSIAKDDDPRWEELDDPDFPGWYEDEYDDDWIDDEAEFYAEDMDDEDWSDEWDEEEDFEGE